jgi:hypothetical protein
MNPSKVKFDESTLFPGVRILTYQYVCKIVCVVGFYMEAFLIHVSIYSDILQSVQFGVVLR